MSSGWATCPRKARMPVIEAEVSQSPYAPFSLVDIEKEAAAILEDARDQVSEITAQWRERGHREGFAQGLAEGRELGRREALEQHAPALARVVGALEEATRQIDAARESLALAGARDATRLAVAIASKVCGDLGLRNHAVAEHNAAAALRLVGRARQVRLCVHPSDADHMRSSLPELQRRYPSLVSIDLTADPAVEAGGCRVETSEGMVDAGLRTQIDRIAADLLGESADFCQ